MWIDFNMTVHRICPHFAYYMYLDDVMYQNTVVSNDALIIRLVIGIGHYVNPYF